MYVCFILPAFDSCIYAFSQISLITFYSYLYILNADSHIHIQNTLICSYIYTQYNTHIHTNACMYVYSFEQTDTKSYQRKYR